MSFILDALRKSEHEREKRALPGLVEAPVSRAASLPLSWLLGGFALLLVVNGMVLGYVLLRPATAPVPVPLSLPAATLPARARVATEPPTATASGRVRPLAAEVASPEPVPAAPEPPPVTHRPAAVAAAPTVAAHAPLAGTVWPTLHQLPPQTVAALPALNLDLHVYSTLASQRFVIINGQRLREGGQLREGLLVEQITPEGAVLNRQGTRFVLTRD